MKTLLILIAMTLTAFAQPKSYQITEIKANGYMIQEFVQEKVTRFNYSKDISFVETKFRNAPQYLLRDETNMSFPLKRKFYADLAVVKVYEEKTKVAGKRNPVTKKTNIVSGSNYRIYIDKTVKLKDKPRPQPTAADIRAEKSHNRSLSKMN